MQVARMPFDKLREKFMCGCFLSSNFSDSRNSQRRLVIEGTGVLLFEQEKSNLEISKTKKLAEVESNKFRAMMDVMGQGTMQAMAEAGPEYQAKLLEGLGLSGFIMTDGNNPINLFNTASQLIG